MCTERIELVYSEFLRQFRSVLLFLLCFPLVKLQAQFTPGRLVVLQAGDGTIPLSSNGNAILFKEFSVNGTPGFSLTVPSTGTNALSIRGSANSEGHISLSEDAACIVFGAYAQALPFSSPLNSPAASTLNRGIGLIMANGSYSLGAIGASPFANGDIRGATATSSLNLWASSSSAGASYYGPASSQGNVQNSKANLRAIHVFNQQLYISSHSAAGTPSVIGIYAVGSGTPVSASQAVSVVINTGNNSQPCQFYFNLANTICYVADSRNSGQGGVQKWIYTANSWSLAYTLPTGTNAAGAQGVVADFSGNFPKVYATSSEGSNNRLVAINDLGPASTATTLATANQNNTVFRGLCFSPGTIPCNAPVVLSAASNAAQCAGDTLTFNCQVIGTAPISYSWSGPGVFSSSSVPNPTVLNSPGGVYTLTASNQCGSSSSTLALNLQPQPQLQVNAPTICSGGQASLNVSGASTYTWSTGSQSNQITVSPSSTSNYTVSGTSTAGCVSAPYTATVFVTSSLSLQVNSATICAGGTATLTVSGASSYTWSNLQNSTSIFVSPSTGSSYTVFGSAPGCPLNATAIATVSVNPLPVLNFTLPASAFCETETIYLLNPQPAGGSLSGPGISGLQFSPTQAGTGIHTLTYLFTDSNSCSNSISQTLSVFACTELAEWPDVPVCTLYPNPAREYLHLRCTSDPVPYQIRLVNSQGQELEYPAGKGKVVLFIQELPPGLYLLELSTHNRRQNLRFIKE